MRCFKTTVPTSLWQLGDLDQLFTRILLPIGISFQIQNTRLCSSSLLSFLKISMHPSTRSHMSCHIVPCFYLVPAFPRSPPAYLHVFRHQSCVAFSLWRPPEGLCPTHPASVFSIIDPVLTLNRLLLPSLNKPALKPAAEDSSPSVTHHLSVWTLGSGPAGYKPSPNMFLS